MDERELLDEFEVGVGQWAAACLDWHSYFLCFWERLVDLFFVGTSFSGGLWHPQLSSYRPKVVCRTPCDPSYIKHKQYSCHKSLARLVESDYCRRRTRRSYLPDRLIQMFV